MAEDPASFFRVDWSPLEFPLARAEAFAKATSLLPCLLSAGDYFAELDEHNALSLLQNCKAVVSVLLWQPYLSVPEKTQLVKSLAGLLEAAVARGLPSSAILLFWDTIQEGRGFWGRNLEVEAILRREMSEQEESTSLPILRQAAALGLAGLDEVF